MNEYIKNTTIKLNEDNGPMDEYTRSTIHSVYEDAKKALLRQKMNEIVKQQWNEGTIYKKFKDLYEIEMKKSTDNINWIWITVNPRPDITLKQLVKCVEKYVKRTFIEKYVYVYEQRGSEENEKICGTGFHSHILIKRNNEANISIYDIKKRTKMAFKNITDVSNSKIFYYKTMPETYVQDKINYMTNKNLDDEHKDKEQKQSMDKLWREQNNLKDIYYSLELENKNNMYIYNNGEDEISDEENEEEK